MHEAAVLEGTPGILAASVAAGYPYADVPDMGPGVVVVTQDDRARAEAEAERLSQQLWSLRDYIRIDLPDAMEAVEKAIATQRPPAVLVEFGDNIGGGSPGDSTALLGEIIRQRAPGAVSVIYDPEIAEECARLGIGGEVRMAVGGKSDEMHGKPVLITGRVRSLHDGTFYEPEQRHGGITRWNQGLTAVIEVAPYAPEPENQTLVVVNSRRTAPMSLVQLTSLGIEAHRKRILTVKAAIAFRAAYEPIAGEIIEVDTPGVTAVNPQRFYYQHVRRPLWPLDPV
jgi:microcystin degradation protein MlrC